MARQGAGAPWQITEPPPEETTTEAPGPVESTEPPSTGVAPPAQMAGVLWLGAAATKVPVVAEPADGIGAGGVPSTVLEPRGVFIACAGTQGVNGGGASVNDPHCPPMSAIGTTGRAASGRAARVPAATPRAGVDARGPAAGVLPELPSVMAGTSAAAGTLAELPSTRGGPAAPVGEPRPRDAATNVAFTGVPPGNVPRTGVPLGVPMIGVPEPEAPDIPGAGIAKRPG